VWARLGIDQVPEMLAVAPAPTRTFKGPKFPSLTKVDPASTNRSVPVPPEIASVELLAWRSVTVVLPVISSCPIVWVRKPVGSTEPPLLKTITSLLAGLERVGLQLVDVVQDAEAPPIQV
jgi:hypothetical protein